LTYENRLPANYAFGTLTGAAAISDTTLTSTDFAARLASGLSTTTYVPITLQDPSTGNFEIVWANAHTAAATTCTVLRARESSTSRAWGSGTLWVVAPTLRDGMLPVPTRTSLPADPHVGMRAYIQDEQVAVTYVLNVGWLSSSGMAYRATQVLGSDAASVSFTAIPSTLKKVQVAWTGRATGAVVVASLLMRINNDSAASYYSNYHQQQQTTISSFVESGATYVTVGLMAGASAAGGSNWGSGEIVVPGWNQPGSRAAVNHVWSSHFYDSAADSFLAHGGGMYTNAGPYTSIVLYSSSSNLKAGSEFTVYGWG
jgi:hypothetical protein